MWFFKEVSKLRSIRKKITGERGQVTACGAALILQCLQRGLYPSWDAANMESVALAEKLGYVLDHPYITFRVQPNTLE